ncbi:acyl-CoA N-acyltransferase [Stipitochalara longipes BDJ]|nr:acyl-CoA N-acyltransferase [Stipitochalara longipes BDJ]
MESKVPKTLTTPRLTLTLFSRSNPAHYECMLSCLNNPTAHTRMGDYGIRTKEQLFALHDATQLTFPNAFPFDMVYIISPTSNRSDLAGAVTLGQRSRELYPDLGWALKEEFMGKGYATEAAREFLRALREEIGVRDVCTWPDQKNAQSNRVAQKLGFVEGGTVRVSDEGGKEVVVWILPEMKGVGKGELEISFWGEGGAN